VPGQRRGKAPLASYDVADTGSADPALAAALEQWRGDPGPRTRARALAALSTARLFAAVTARSTAEHVDAGTGLRAESTAEMSLVTLAGSTGRGLPAFLDVPSVTGFVDGARPVRVSAQEICRAALDDGAAAVVVDPPGAALVLAGSELAELAAGRTPVAGAGGLSTRRTTAAALSTPERPDRELLAALRVALRGERVTGRLLDGPDGPVLGVVGVTDPAQLAALAARLQPRLPRPLDLAAVPSRGPGVPIEHRRAWLRRGR
jgi:hypothetical protein